ncbi:phospholipase D-like domain-containing protein, partial [Chloroflexota bacterium]
MEEEDVLTRWIILLCNHNLSRFSMRKYAIVPMILLLLTGCSLIKDLNFNESRNPVNPGIPVAIGDPGRSTDDPGEANKNIEIFFSDPTNISGEKYDYGPERFMVQAIKSAVVSVDIAIYNFNLWDVRDALLEVFNRGVTVRVVIESENMENEVVQQLKQAGIQVIGDRRESLMHNKFIIVDRIDVWTGSMNFTVGSAYYDNNNLVHIHSPEVAGNYQTEFNEMFVLDMFGDNIMSLTPDPLVLIDDSLVEIYFSPDDDVAEHIIEIINQANESIVFMAYSFTSDVVSAAIIEKFN